MKLIFCPSAPPFPLSCGQGQDNSGLVYSLSFKRSRKRGSLGTVGGRAFPGSVSLGDFAFYFNTNPVTDPKLYLPTLLLSFPAFASWPWHFPVQKLSCMGETLRFQTGAWFLALRLSSSLLSTRSAVLALSRIHFGLQCSLSSPLLLFFSHLSTLLRLCNPLSQSLSQSFLPCPFFGLKSLCAYLGLCLKDVPAVL